MKMNHAPSAATKTKYKRRDPIRGDGSQNNDNLTHMANIVSYSNSDDLNFLPQYYTYTLFCKSE